MVWRSRLVLVALCVAACASAYDYCEAGLPEQHPLPFDASLVQVAVVTRHGDRTPISVLPRNHENVVWECDLPEFVSVFSSAEGHTFQQSYISPQSFGGLLWQGNCTPGQLTLKGAMQARAVGQRMRQIYVETYGLLPRQFDPSLVYVRSTDIWRTKQTAMGHMNGLYPPETVRRGTVLRLNTAPTNIETLFPNSDACPMLGRLNSKVRESQEWKSRVAGLADVRTRIDKQLGTAGMWTDQFSAHADVLHGRKCHGLDTPVADKDMQAIFEQADWEQTYLPDRIPRLSMGFFLQELAEFLSTRGTSGPRYGLFSAHDSSVVALMAALGSSENWPPFASSVVFEQWRSREGRYFVRVQYNGELRVPRGCSSAMCPIEEFTSLVRSLAVDYDTECLN
eukprot:m51a1_g11335 hypothetical protein (395) ;mRNA; r:144977-146729